MIGGWRVHGTSLVAAPCVVTLVICLLFGAKASDAGAFQEPAPAFIRVFQRTNADV